MNQSHLEEIITTQRYETWVSHGGVSHDSSICAITPYGLLNFKQRFECNTIVRNVRDYLQFGAP